MLFVFDPDRAAVFLVAGDEAGQWSRWYEDAIPLAEARAELDAYVGGHHLKELRKSLGKAQTEIAQILGVSQSRISQIENGNIEAMELETLRA
jgi:DNA-binding XRE family transcriptional regulator